MMDCDYESFDSDIIGNTGLPPRSYNGNDSCSLESSLSSFPLIMEDTKDDAAVTHFKETFEHLENMTRFLVCSKCEKLPKEKVWTLGCCLHKYCEDCAKELSGRKCLVCQQTGYPKDAKPDLFSSSILLEIPKVYLKMLRLEELGRMKQDAEEKEAAEEAVEEEEKIDEGPEEDEKMEEGIEEEQEEAEEDSLMKLLEPELLNDEELLQKASEDIPHDLIRMEDPYDFRDADEDEEGQPIECTPKDQGIVDSDLISQDFPEVLEETPHNKVKGRPSLKARTSNQGIPSRALAFPSQDKEADAEIKKVADIFKIASPEKGDQSDEELFRSQPNDGGGANGETSPGEELPVLTPYENATKKTSNICEGVRAVKIDFATGIPTPKKAPALTPYKKQSDEAKDAEKSPEEERPKPTPAVRKLRKASSSSSTTSVDSNASRKSLRGRKPKVIKSEESPLPAAKAKTPKDSSSANVTPKLGQKKSIERNRRISTSSVASSSSSGRDSAPPPITPGSKVKRNAKGETALHTACKTVNLEKVTTLIDSGADVNAKDNAGWTPMHELINGKGSFEQKAVILRFLCEKGGDVNALGGLEEVTPLHSAVLSGSEFLVEILLEFGASPNIRNTDGQLPRDIAFNDVIAKLLEEKMGTAGGPPENANLDNTTFTSTTSMVEEDPAVMQVMLKKALIYFNYDVDSEVVKTTKEKLNLKVSETLTSKVTHIVHDLADRKQKSSSRVPLSIEYLFALGHGMWQISSDWITKSLKNGACAIPTTYEINGHLKAEENAVDDEEFVPSLSRMNREKGNPCLFDGFLFNFYHKNHTFTSTSPPLTLDKKQLTDLIITSGGKVINREPDPTKVNPLDEAPTRFHALHPTRKDDSGINSSSSSTSNNEKFILTSHIIIYDTKSPPPTSKLYSMEHVKTLKIDWLINSLLHFRLEDPEKY